MSTLVPDVASWFASATREREGGFIQHELASNKLIHGVREVEALREILLNAASNDMDTTDSDADVHLLVPQSVTLDEVEVTPELVETHCVLLQRGANGQPRGFRSLNGLCGTCQPDDTVVVHGRRPRAATASGWNFGARGTVPQLESHIHILREAHAPWSKCPPCLGSMVPQLASCAPSGRSWRLWAAWYSQSGAQPLGAPPPPRRLE